MKIESLATDDAILRELGARLSRIRLDRNLKQVDLAREAGIAKRTLERMEAGGATQMVNLVRVCRALGLVENFEALIPPPMPSPIEQLKMHGKKRRRAATAKPPQAARQWKWGDNHEDEAEAPRQAAEQAHDKA